MLTFTSSLVLERENPLRQPKAENRETDCSEFLDSSLSFLLVGFPTQTTTVQQIADQPHPIRACSLVVRQCIAFATSFLLASQTTSVAATASCMTTSYTTTKLSHVDDSAGLLLCVVHQRLLVARGCFARRLFRAVWQRSNLRRRAVIILIVTVLGSFAIIPWATNGRPSHSRRSTRRGVTRGLY